VYPLGHEDCHWNAAAYPAQFMAASGYLMDGDPADEEAALHCLTALAHKIDCETLMGAPLICGGQEWLPGAYHLARAYVRERAERSYRDRTLEQAQVISAAKRLFNATEAPGQLNVKERDTRHDARTVPAEATCLFNAKPVSDGSA
jgi:hypothetical protein